MEILEKSRSAHYIQGALQASNGIGSYHFKKGDYERATVTFDSVAGIAEKHTMLHLQTNALYNKALALHFNNLSYSAVQEALKCLKISEAIGDYKSSSKSYNLLGGIYIELEDYKKSMDYYTKAIDLSRKAGDESAYFIASCNYCSCFIGAEKTTEGLECLNKVAEDFKGYKGSRKLYISILLEGERLDCAPKDDAILDEIHANLILAAKQEELQKSNKNKIQIYTNLTKYHILRGNLKNARMYLERSKWLLDQGEYWYYIIELVQRVESELLELEGNHKEALELYHQYMEKQVHDFRNDESNRIHELTLLYEAEKKETALAAKEMELQVIAASADKRQWSLIVGGVVTFLLVLLAFAIYLRHKNRLLKMARKEALQASKIKSRFLDVMSHELRTPLSTIAGAVFLLDEENDPKTQQNHIRNLKFASQYLNRLIENTIVLKTLGEPKTHKNPVAEPQGRPFNCRNLIEGICQSIAHSQNNNRAKIYMDPDIPEYLLGPELDLERILTNLVTNSNKFTQNGLIRVSAKKSRDLYPEGMELSFTVEDNGQGIPEDEKEKVFDPFFTGKEHKYHEYPGMGLGLNLVKGLLEKHKSAPKMESVYALGTTIRFSLRFQKADAPADFGLPKEIVLKRPQGKVLLVEDNSINQGITQKIIQGLGYQCEVADNGKMALEKYREGRYDLVLMDILMPEMDGFEASASIYDLDAKANIVALTAVSKEKYRDLFNKLNIKTVIHKPVDATIIKKVLHDHVPLGPRAA